MATQTNINNINNINYKNDEVNKLATDNDGLAEQSLHLLTSSPEASPPLLAEKQRESDSLRCELPEKTRFIKMDLFRNPGRTTPDGRPGEDRFKLSVAICRDQPDHTQRIVQFRAALNSPPRYVKRGVQDVWYSDPHYRLVDRIMTALELEDQSYRVSKCYRQRGRLKGQIQQGITVFLIGETHVILVLGEQVFEAPLESLTLTQKQREGHVIGTVMLTAYQTVPQRQHWTEAFDE